MVAKRWSHFAVEVGDLLLSTSGTLGRVSIATDAVRGGIPYTGIIRMRPANEDIDAGFIRYFLTSPLFGQQAMASAAGSVLKHFGPSHLREMSFPLPPLAEQRAIAAVLGALDDKIEQNRRTGRALEGLARATFKAWFVDFEPVKAKAAGAAGFPGMPPAAFAALPTRLTDSPLGPVPEGWKIGSLDDVIGLLQGYAFRSKDWSDSGVPVVKIGSVKPGVVDLSAVSFVSEELAAEATKYRLAAGDLLIGMTGYVGEVGLIPPTQNLPLLNQRVSKVLLKTPGTGELGFPYCFMRRQEFKEAVEARAHGTAQANVSGVGILSIPLVIPSEILYGTFNELAKGLLDLILANLAESSKLASLRDYLLPRLLSGRVQVRECAPTLEAVEGAA